MGYLTGDQDCTTHIVSAAIIAATFINVADLNWAMFSLFERKHSLYFWSFFASTWGVFSHQLGFLLRNFEIITNPAAYTAIIASGWVAMVTGQSLVLYSRLHLLVHNRKTLRLVLGMIITNVFICHVPIIILVYGGSVASNLTGWGQVYKVYEKLQITLFFFQEVVISSLYVWAMMRAFPMQNQIHGDKARRMRRHVVAVNIVVIVLDIVVLSIGYAGLFDVQTVTKAFLYSLKLKVEFTILNSLKGLARSKHSSRENYKGYGGSKSHHRTRWGNEIQPGEIPLDAQPAPVRTADSAYARGGNPAGTRECSKDGIIMMNDTEFTHERGFRKDVDSVEARSTGAGPESLDDAPRPTPSVTSQTGLARFYA